MKSDFDSDVFAKYKDKSFESSVDQIQQTFDNEDLYPTIEEKAAMLLSTTVGVPLRSGRKTRSQEM